MTEMIQEIDQKRYCRQLKAVRSENLVKLREHAKAIADVVTQ